MSKSRAALIAVAASAAAAVLRPATASVQQNLCIAAATSQQRFARSLYMMSEQKAQEQEQDASVAKPAAVAPEPESSVETSSRATETETPPPTSFLTLVEQAAAATNAAISDSSRLMEVEFPPVPLSKLEDTSISSNDLLRANLQLALEYCKRLVRAVPGDGDIALSLPDIAERERATDIMGDKEPFPGVRLWALSGGDGEQTIGGFFGSLVKGATAVEPAPWAKLYVILSVSCSELPSLRSLAEEAPDAPIVCFNLKLDTLRGDLGLPTFPGRDMHHDFLSRVKPVYYMRPRSYSLSLSRPPFLISYAGVLFRCYPEGFQTLLDRGRGTYRQVMVQEERPALGSFKAQLTQALKLADESANSAISQTGFKQSTWWEDNSEDLDVSKDWVR